jgi:hypothetical protein
MRFQSPEQNAESHFPMENKVPRLRRLAPNDFREVGAFLAGFFPRLLFEIAVV